MPIRISYVGPFGLCLAWALSVSGCGPDSPGPGSGGTAGTVGSGGAAGANPGGTGGTAGSEGDGGPNTGTGGSAGSAPSDAGTSSDAISEGGSGSSDPAVCHNEMTQILQLDELTSLGFTPNDVLLLAQGTRPFPLAWQAPYSGSSELQIDVQPSGAARLVHRVPSAVCPVRVEVDIDVKLSTPDNAIDESFKSTLFAYTSDIARFDHDLDAAAIQRIAAKQPGAPVPTSLQTPAVFTRYGGAGSLYGEWTTPPGPPDGAAKAQGVAVWPFLSKCHSGVPILYPDVHPSIADLVEPLRGAGRVERADGSTATAIFAPRVVERSSCYRANSIVESDDGLETLVDIELDPVPGKTVTLTFRISADLLFGKIGFGDIRGPVSPCTTPGGLDVASFAAQCGDWGVDLSGYDGAYLEVIGQISPTSWAGADVTIIGRRGINEFTTVGKVFFGRSQSL